MEISQTVTELWCVQQILGNKDKAGVTWKLRMENNLHTPHCLYLLHIPTKLHEVIMNNE